MKLIVGLGNPGSEYANTRHNIGFMAVERLAHSMRAKDLGRRWHGVLARASFGGTHVYMLKPQTYMNNSGSAVTAAVKELNPDPENLLIVYDDLALPLGTLRFRLRGSDGGQKGMLSIIQALGHQDVPRLRLGIGADSVLVPREFVLQRFSQQETALVEEMLLQSTRAMELWVHRGIGTAMNRYNGPVSKDL